MSNAMRTSKRWLAGAAAGALVAGMAPLITATAASAYPTLSESAATVGPVRWSTAAGTNTAGYANPVVDTNASPLMFEPKVSVTADDSIQMTLTNAPQVPGGWAKLYLSSAPTLTLDDTGTTAAGAEATLTLENATNASTTRATVTAATWLSKQNLADDSVLDTYLRVSVPGTYAGQIRIYQGTATAAQTVTFTFTTAKAPATTSLAPTSVTLANSTDDTKVYVASVKDADGKLTQLATSNEAYALSVSTATTNAGLFNIPSGGATVDYRNFDDTDVDTLGTATLAVYGNNDATAGSRTLNWAPTGFLPTGAATALGVTVVTRGGIGPNKFTLTAPTTQVLDDTVRDDTMGYDVNAVLVSAATVTTTGSTPSAPFVVGVESVIAGLKINGVAASAGGAAVVTANSSGVGTMTLGWTAGATGRIILESGSGSAYRSIILDVINPTNDSATIPGGAVVIKTGENQNYAVTLADSFGNPLSNYTVIAKTTSDASPSVNASSTPVLTGLNGTATVVAPPPSATFTGAATVTFTVLNATGTPVTSGIGTLASVAATYSDSGAVTSLSVAVSGGSSTPVTSASGLQPVLPYILVPSDGQADTAATGTYTSATGAGTAAGEVVTINATPTPGNTVTISVPEGVKVSRTASTLWSGGAQTLDFASSTDAYIFATKTGEHEITVTSGEISVTMKIRVDNAATDAYNIGLSPTSMTVPTNGFKTFELSVTDVFGNGVDTDFDDGTVLVKATGQVVLGGFNAEELWTTGSDGKAIITAIGDREAGVGKITAVNAVRNNAWAPDYTPPTGAPAPVKAAEMDVTVTASATKSITIAGSRTEVRGKPGIVIDGVTTGIEDGKTVIPYFRFPGSTEYTQGSARPVIQDEEFTWERKTGKKFYAYVTNDDGAVKSNRVIIPAR